MPRSRLSSSAGMSLMEMIIFSMIAAVVMLGATYFLSKPGKIRQMVGTADVERDASKALDRMVNELREADPDSFPWTVLPSTAPLVIAKSSFDMATHTYQNQTRVAYYYQPSTDHSGALMRQDQTQPDPTTVLSPIDAPTDDDPLFQIDPVLHVIMISVEYHPWGGQPHRVVRRVSLAN